MAIWAEEHAMRETLMKSTGEQLDAGQLFDDWADLIGTCIRILWRGSFEVMLEAELAELPGRSR